MGDAEARSTKNGRIARNLSSVRHFKKKTMQSAGVLAPHSLGAVMLAFVIH
jgi:hypothetical protein